MNRWIELEDTFLSNAKVWSKDEPTEYYLFTVECTRLKRYIRRKRCLHTLKGKNSADLDAQLLAFTERSDVVCVPGRKS